MVTSNMKLPPLPHAIIMKQHASTKSIGSGTTHVLFVLTHTTGRSLKSVA